ncbi:MAG: type II secretion system F family protein [Acidilobaceae archaeon]
MDFIDVYDYISLSLFGRITDWFTKTFELEDALKKAGWNLYPPLYSARVLMATLLSLLVSLYVILVVWWFEFSLTFRILVSVFSLLVPIFVLAIGLMLPSLAADSRRNRVNSELPFFAAYLTSMSLAGVGLMHILERISKLKVFFGIRREAIMIFRNAKYMGLDPIDALERNAYDHPSSLFRDFVLGYITVLKTGANLVDYLEVRTRDIFSKRIEELELISSRVAMYSELYIIIAVVIAITFYVFFTMTSMQPTQTGFGGVYQFALFSFIVLPLMTLVVMYLVDRVQPKTPIRITSPYLATLNYGVPIALLASLIVFQTSGAYRVLEGIVDKQTVIGLSMSVGVFFIALSVPGAIAWMRESRRARGAGLQLALFLRELVETRKTGLAPEKAIVILSKRDYGPLNPVLKKIASALAMGADIEQAATIAVRGYKNWLLLATMRFLVDAITYGGGSPETLESLARYSKSLSDLEEELTKKLKVYTIMPYVGAVLVAGSSLLMVGLASQSLVTGATGPRLEAMKEQLMVISLVASLGSILNSWLMGLTAGKISSGTVAAGFLHAILTTSLAMVTSVATLSYLL